VDPNKVVEDQEEDILDIELGDIPEGDEDTPTGDNKSNKDVPGETNEPELSEIEKIAYSQGWRPKEDFVKSGNDPKAWKDAGWWLDRGELLGQLSNTRKEVKAIKEAFIRMTEYNRSAYIKGQEDGIAKMKAEKRQAMKDGDLNAVADLDERIEQVSETLQVAKETAMANPIPDSPAEQNLSQTKLYQDWLTDNRWYTTNEKLHNFANFTMAQWVKTNPNATPGEALAYLTKTVKETYPNDFTGTRRVASPSVDGRGNQSRSSASPNNSVDARFAKIVGQMDPETRRAVLDMVRSESITKKEYVEMYQD